PPGAGRLLADAAAGRRNGLVAKPRGLAANPDLDEHGIGAVERTVELSGRGERSIETLALEDPPRQPTDHLSALGIDVMQHALAHVDPLALARQPRDELRRIGRARADHRQLHRLTPGSLEGSCLPVKSVLLFASSYS